jgi:hypothetical protein
MSEMAIRNLPQVTGFACPIDIPCEIGGKRTMAAESKPNRAKEGAIPILKSSCAGCLADGNSCAEITL